MGGLGGVHRECFCCVSREIFRVCTFLFFEAGVMLRGAGADIGGEREACGRREAGASCMPLPTTDRVKKKKKKNAVAAERAPRCFSHSSVG